MPGIRLDVDPDGLLEYSVVFTDRSLNHMSQSFQGVMRDISETLKSVYNATSIAIADLGDQPRSVLICQKQALI